MRGGTWLIVNGKKVPAVRDADGVARPIEKKTPKPKTPKRKAGGE